MPSSTHREFLVPVAKDGTWFAPDLARKGFFAIGEKGHEQKIQGYLAALEHLTNMPVAKWRRPNDAGNWGIVSAVRWVTKVIELM